jgi:hypothetical protein
MTIDIDKLRRLAQAATPGPWYVTGKLTRYVEARIDGGLIQEVAACGPTKADGGYGPQQEANARLIAAANPAAISELLDRLEAAEKERDFAKTEIARLHDDIRELTDVRVLDAEDRDLIVAWKAAKRHGAKTVLRAPDAVMAALDNLDDYIARIEGNDRGACDHINLLRRYLLDATEVGENE